MSKKMTSKSIKKNQIGNRKAGSRTEKIMELSLIRTYPHQVAWQVWLPGTPTKFTTTVTTGLIAGVINVVSTSITSFATRFSQTFVEYRMIRAIFRIRLFSSTNPGVLQFWVDEKSNATPILAEAQERATLISSAAAVDKTPVLKWVSADPLDLQYIATSASATLATFKVFTNNTNFGSSIVATDYLEVEPVFEVQFRGLQGV